MDGWELLALCILAPQYMTPELVIKCVETNTPLVNCKTVQWITDDIVDQIFEYCKTEKQVRCAEDYGLTQSTVSKILLGKRHKRR